MDPDFMRRWAGRGDCSYLPEDDHSQNWAWDQDGKGAQAPADSLVFTAPSLLPPLSSGKFGAVCTCTEKATGLKLAAKVIKKQTPKDKVVGENRLYRWEGVPGWAPLTSSLHLRS
jgi:hypothetical protein